MPAGLGAGRHGPHHGPRDDVVLTQENAMTWQTPQAQDFRFGFEITMYVAAR